jgi:hypothetical protein
MKSEAGGKRDLVGGASVDYDRLESEITQWSWSNDGAMSNSELCTGDLLGLREGSEHYSYSDMAISASSNFYTPLTRSTPTKSRAYQGVYCDAHTPCGSHMSIRDLNPADADLYKARTEQSERNRLSSWPAALQKVVVGDVKEGVIAKRRRSTLKRRE